MLRATELGAHTEGPVDDLVAAFPFDDVEVPPRRRAFHERGRTSGIVLCGQMPPQCLTSVVHRIVGGRPGTELRFLVVVAGEYAVHLTAHARSSASTLASATPLAIRSR